MNLIAKLMFRRHNHVEKGTTAVQSFIYYTEEDVITILQELGHVAPEFDGGDPKLTPAEERAVKFGMQLSKLNVNKTK